MYDDLVKPFGVLIEGILGRASTLVLDGSYAGEIGPFVDHHSLEAKSAEQLLVEAFSADKAQLLDFGCGRGAYRRMIESFGYEWHGVDYLGGVAPGAVEEVAKVGEISFYDGKKLPYKSDSFDVIYSFLVFEHIQYVDLTFSEIERVLKPGGKLIGQVAYLEQIHDYSTFNFTPFGLKLAAERNGLSLRMLYPATDAFTFLMRRLMVVSTASDDTPLDKLMGGSGFFHQTAIKAGLRLGLTVEQINLFRLQFSTHFVFELEK